MAEDDTDLDATAYPANSQTMTAKVMARSLSEDRMTLPSLTSSVQCSMVL